MVHGRVILKLFVLLSNCMKMLTMKKYFIGGCFAILAALLVVSCQSEAHESQVSPEALNKSSQLTSLLGRVAQATAVDDNVLDGATCFSIKLPVDVVVNGHFLQVNNATGYQEVADILNASNTDNNNIVYNYPITIIYQDGHQMAVDGDSQYHDLQQECPVAPAEIPIGCFDMVYPFSISVYDSSSQTPQIVTINNGYNLLAFIVNLSPAQFFQINFPVSAVVNGETMDIDSNSELLGAINAAIEGCDCANENVLTDDLVTYIPFGGEITDLTGFSSPVVLGEHHYVADRNGNPSGAFSFDGGGENHIAIPANASNNMMANGKFTVSFWFNRQLSGPEVPEYESLFNTQSGFSIMLGNQSNPSIRSPFVNAPGLINPLYDIGWIESEMFGSVGLWHHIAVVYDSGLLRLYRDGALQNEAIDISFPDVLAGGNFGGDFFGYLDDIRIYKKALNAGEVGTLYQLEGDINTCLN